jgi:DNA-binding GntR family transcriptional regulator
MQLIHMSQPLREHIYNKLIKRIASGAHKPGEKLSEAELTKHFNVSRTPIREAFVKLEEEGLITHKKNVGAFVTVTDAVKIEQILNLLAVLEGYAVEIVATIGMDKKSLSYLKQLVRDSERMATKENYYEYMRLNHKFHSFFIKNCGNDILRKIVGDCTRKLSALRGSGFTLPRFIDDYLKAHRNLLKAIVAKKTVEAGNLMRQHILDAKEFIILEQTKQSNSS